MVELEELTQDNEGILYRADGTRLRHSQAESVGKLKTIINHTSGTMKGRLSTISLLNKTFIPESANAYVISEGRSMNDNHEYVYAIQFYQLFPQ